MSRVVGEDQHFVHPRAETIEHSQPRCAAAVYSGGDALPLSLPPGLVFTKPIWLWKITQTSLQEVKGRVQDLKAYW